MNEQKREERKDKFIKDAIAIYGDVYDYSRMTFKNVKTKVEIYCTKHNNTFMQTPQMHLRGSGCKKCQTEVRSKSKTKTKEQFVKEAMMIHGDKYNFDNINYRHSHERIYPECNFHGKFETTPSIILSGSGCSKCASEAQQIPFKTLVEQFKEIHGDTYLYDQAENEYCGASEKIPIKCMNPDHGVFWQTPSDHKQGRGCPKCKTENMRYDTETFVRLANMRHNNLYDYSKTIYTGTKNKVLITCKFHGDFLCEPNAHLSSGRGCPKCANHISNPETDLQEYIKTLTKIETNNRKIINPKELDIYIPSKNLAIEFNGIYWHGELKGCTKKYHLNKTLECNKKGIRLLHITDDEWINKAAIVKSRLKNILGLTKYKLYGRKCEIKEIDAKIKNKFLNKYHIQGEDKSSIKLGAFYKNRLVAVMTFGKNRYGKDENCYELIRYATISSFNCIGVAGKLLKHFERNYEGSKIKTYADLRWSEGNLYKQLGFNHKHNSNPNYFYTKCGKIIGSRVQFQKHKLKNKLDKFDPNMTEWENMKANGYDRIWDCGNMVFEKSLI